MINSCMARTHSRMEIVVSNHARIVLVCAALSFVTACAPQVRPKVELMSVADTGPTWETGTFSILAYDPATGELGGAVQSRVFSVGNGVLWAEAGVGAVATQAVVDVSYGPQALALLRKG